ncbi:hypothetical protein FM107_01695 [Sphingobacterium sp. JB170]|nr:hypothetical protein FM107_01695 [Sphingobacterium sp. JB170]
MKLKVDDIDIGKPSVTAEYKVLKDKVTVYHIIFLAAKIRTQIIFQFEN